MKKFISFSLVGIAVSALFVACNKEVDSKLDSQDEFVTISITANNPDVEPGTKTEIDGTTPYWSKGDAIGVAYRNENSYGKAEFASGLTERAVKATFSAQVASDNLGKTAYAFYPYTSNAITDAGIAPIDIPETQYPSLTSFDSKADLMVGLESFELSTTVSEMAFRRLGAVVKVIIIDNTTGSVLTGQHPVDLKLTVAENIVGRAKIDLANKALDGYSSGAKNYVRAVYNSEKYAIDGTNATYFVVYPQTLSANSGITFEGTTEGYSFTKEITTHPEIDLEAGRITTLKIKVDAATVDESGASLPFHEDFSALDSGNSTSTSGSSVAASTTDLDQFKTVTTGYKAGGAIRLGKNGLLETKALNLSDAFSVVVRIKGWSANETTLTATVGEGADQQSYNFVATTAIGGDFVEFSHKFSAATKKSSVVFTTDANTRVFIDDIRIVSGDYVITPIISVPSVPAAAKSTDTSIEFNYEITNPVTGGELTVEESVDWITNVSVDQENKKVTLTISTASEARNAEITLKYPGAEDFVLNVSQRAPSTGYELLNAAPADWTNGWLIICGGDERVLTGGASGGYGMATAVTVSSGVISKATGDAVACTVENGSTAGRYAIKLSSGEYIGSVSTNSFAVSNEPVDLTISVAANGEISIDVDPTTNRFIKYLSSNENSKAFRCYTGSTGVLPKAYWRADSEPRIAATGITFDSAISANKTSTISWYNFESAPTVTVTTSPLPAFINTATVSADGSTLTVNVKDNYTLTENSADLELSATLGSITKTTTVHIVQPASVFEASSTADLTFEYDDEDPQSVTITSTFPLSETVNLTNSNETNFTASLTLVPSTTYQYILEVMPNQVNNEESTNYEAVITVSRNGIEIPINVVQQYDAGEPPVDVTGPWATWGSSSAFTVSSNAVSSKVSTDFCGTDATLKAFNSSGTSQTITAGRNSLFYFAYFNAAAGSYWQIDLPVSEKIPAGTKLTLTYYHAVNSGGITSWTVSCNDNTIGDPVTINVNGSPAKLGDMTRVEKSYTTTVEIAAGSTISFTITAGSGTAKNNRITEISVVAE